MSIGELLEQRQFSNSDDVMRWLFTFIVFSFNVAEIRTSGLSVAKFLYFGEILSQWQFFEGVSSIWQNLEPTLAIY